MHLSQLGLHELEPPPDHLLTQLNPQVYVTVQQCNHPDNIAKGQARVRHLKALLPNTKIGVRWYCGEHGDDKQSTRMTPTQYANDYFHLHVPGTLLMPDNEAEASKADPNVVRRVVAWWVDIIRRATDAGIPLGIGCFPTGNPDYPQYDLLLPMFVAMRDAARDRGIVHWWRPNAYFVPSEPSHKRDHVERHQREGRRVCASAGIPFPPVFLGELSPLGNITDAHFGFRKMGLNGGQAAQLCIDKHLDVPAAFYASGKGVAGTGSDTWRFFNVLRNLDGTEETSWFAVASTRAMRVLDNTNHAIEQLYIQEARKVAAQGDYGTKQPQGRVSLINASGVKFREAPANGAQIDVFKGGEVVSFWDKVVNGWWRIEWNGRIGYASATYLAIAKIETSPPPTIPEFPDTIEAAQNLVNLLKEGEVASQIMFQFANRFREWVEDWIARNGLDSVA